MIDLVSVGKKIASLRNAGGYSQEALAGRLYVSRQAVSAWELGKSAPTIDNVIELSALFNVSFEEILCLNEEPIALPRDDPFAGRDRSYVIRGVAEGKIHADLPSLFPFCTIEERMRLLRAAKKGALPISERLRSVLTIEETNYLFEGGGRK
ncbi:MAG: helix-turn-helix domain-containing protein [Bacilli bacterium]|jgi:transcriptional regulator with XRE-family HTH domain|nr:helix-turn-helix domain-containing protein [Bacilli bacterium]